MEGRRTSVEEEVIERQPWYWGGIPKEDATEILDGAEHGQFLVRDSSELGEYTLVVRTMDAVRCVRIVRREGCYGLVWNKCHYSSVTALVRQLLQNHLLLQEDYPQLYISRPFCKIGPSDSVTTSDLLMQLVCKTKESISHQRQYTAQQELRRKTSKDQQSCEWAINALKMVLTVYREHMEEHNEIIKNVTTEEARGLVDNRKLLHGRIDHVSEELEMQERSLTDLKNKDEELLLDLEQKRPVLAILKAEQKQLQRQVESKGIIKDYLDLLLREETDVDIKHLKQDFWNVSCDRDRANVLLAGKVPGTFLVRPGKKGYALSVVRVDGDATEINHCVIYHNPSQGYGFHPDYCIFASLEELVIKHRALPLYYYNPQLDVCLTYPVNYHPETDNSTRDSNRNYRSRSVSH